MAKTKEELMAAYRKASKPARLVIIGKAGFTSEKEYFDYLDTLESSKGKKTLTDFFGKKKDTDVGKDEGEGGLDQVICFDTTGSMSGYISAVRRHVTELIPKIFKENKDVRIKIVAFGDYCDMSGPDDFGIAYQQTNLTNDQDELIRFVKNAQRTSGGDGDEFYELVIKKVTEETPWRKNARKAVLLIADADPHKVGYTYHGIVTNSQIDWKEEAKKAADKGISWDTMNCGGGYIETFYQPLSKITNGVHIPFVGVEKAQDIIHATTAARGGTLLGKKSFMASYATATTAGDDSLVGAYKSMTTLDTDLEEATALFTAELKGGGTVTSASAIAEKYLDEKEAKK